MNEIVKVPSFFFFQELGLSTLDVLLLLFGHALALTEIGQIEVTGVHVRRRGGEILHSSCEEYLRHTNLPDENLWSFKFLLPEALVFFKLSSPVLIS